MAWLYVPVLAESISASNSQCPAIEPSVTWREKSMRPPSWRLAWKRGILTPYLSGLTSEPSTRDRGVESWISSLRASRASHSVSLVSESTNPTNGISGHRSHESLANASQLSFSWRTSLFERLSSHGETFEDWASQLRRPLRVPPPSWVRDILGAASSFLPTATQGYGSNCGGAAGRVGKVRPSLDRLLPTLSARDWKSGAASEATHMRNARPFNEVMRRALLPTLRNRTGGKANTHRGQRNATTDDLLGGFVNPNWKDWFMGFPIGWTAIEPLATRLFLQWLRSHSKT